MIATPERMKRLLEAVPSNNLQVLYDPYNFLTYQNYQRQDEIAQQVFDWYGDKIMALHAKDFVVENEQVKAVPIGQGMMHYELLFKLLKERKPYAGILLEGQSTTQMESAIKYLESIYERV